MKPLVVEAEKGASAAKVANHTGQIWGVPWADEARGLIATPRKHRLLEDLSLEALGIFFPVRVQVPVPVTQSEYDRLKKQQEAEKGKAP